MKGKTIMDIGFAQQCITPSLPLPLSGFLKQRIAKTVHDDLFVKVLIYRRGQEIYGILSYDLIAVDDLVIHRMNEGMEQLHLKKENFLFTATHTHSGPGGVIETREGLLKPSVDVFIKTNPALIEFIAKKSLQALQEAVSNCKKTSVSYAKSTLPNVGDNRNCRDFKGNPELTAAFLEQNGGKKAVILHYACHPTVMNGENLKVSADFPGAIAACMQRHGYDMCMYINGSCGDISTRFSRKSSHEDELMRYGHMFEKKLLEMKRHAKPAEIHDFTIAHEICRLDLKQPGNVEQAQKELNACEKRLQEAVKKGIGGSELRVIKSYLEGAQSNLSLAQNPFSATAWDISVMFIRINRQLFVCVPGELFSELSNSLQDEQQVHFIGYSNGYVGYFADEFAYDNFYYEALSSPFQKGQGEKLIQFISKKGKEL